MPTIFGDKVEIGGVTFNDTAENPSGAVVWGLDAIEGWDDSVALVYSSTARGAGQDGELFGGYFPAKARNLLLGGYVWASSRAEAESLMDTIVGQAFPPNEDLLLVRHEPVPKQMVVRTTDSVEFQRIGPDKFRWMVPVSSEKAFKFSTTVESGGPVGPAGNAQGGITMPITFPLEFSALAYASDNSIGLTNSGTAPSYAEVVLTGPLTRGAWRVANETTGEYIGFDISAVSGDQLEIDFENQTATLNGDLITSMMFGDFWRLKQKTTNVIKLYASYHANTTISASARSAWR